LYRAKNIKKSSTLKIFYFLIEALKTKAFLLSNL